MTSKALEDLEQRIDYRFHNPSLLVEAFSHSSLQDASPKSQADQPDFERLEFLGDALLNFLTARKLFLALPAQQEGTMTISRSKIVSNQHLEEVAEDLSLLSYLKFGKSMKAQQIEASKRLKSNLVEALLGAIYLDSESREGMAAAEVFFERFIWVELQKEAVLG